MACVVCVCVFDWFGALFNNACVLSGMYGVMFYGLNVCVMRCVGVCVCSV